MSFGKLYQIITDNLPSDHSDAHHNFTMIRTTTAYTAPELMGNIWIRLWEWMQSYVIPHDTEPWTIPIREVWQECMEIVNSNPKD